MDPEAARAPLEVSPYQKDAPEKVACSCNRCFGIFCGTFWAIVILFAFYPNVLCSLGWTSGWLFWLQGERTPLAGTYRVGTVRDRLPAAGGRSDCGLYAQVHYPIAQDAEEFEGERFPLWRSESIPLVFGGGASGGPSSLAGAFECIGDSLLGGQSPLDPQAKPMAGPSGGWPVVIFSQGLSATVEMYQQLCRDIASLGAIVVAVEHEDGSGSYATDCVGKEIFFESGNIDLRRLQLDTRVVEYTATVEAIQTIIGGQTSGDSPMEAVIRTGDAEKLILSGHSFGGCGAFYYMQSLAKSNTTTPFKGAILFDTWAGPLTEDDYSVPIQEPFVEFTSDGWTSIPQLKAIHEMNPETMMASAQVSGVTHDWVTEAALFLWPSIIRCCSPRKSVGDGDYKTTYRNTMLAVEDTFNAILDPALRSTLSGRILDIAPGIIVPFD